VEATVSGDLSPAMIQMIFGGAAADPLAATAADPLAATAAETATTDEEGDRQPWLQGAPSVSGSRRQ